MTSKYLTSLLVTILFVVLVASHTHHSRTPKSKIVHKPKSRHHVVGNVRSFSFEDSPEGSGNANKRTVYKSLEEEFSQEKRKVVAKAYKDAINTVLDLSLIHI